MVIEMKENEITDCIKSLQGILYVNDAKFLISTCLCFFKFYLEVKKKMVLKQPLIFEN